SFESEILTEQRRQAAADAIEDVLVLDPEIREQQVSELDRILSAISEQRADETRSASAKESAIQEIGGTNLSPEVARTIIAVEDQVWAVMRDEARDALSRTLTGAV